jgi:DNA-binding Xre family transcriptional regulator
MPVKNRLAALIAEQSIREGRKIDIAEVAEATDVSRTTLHKYIRQDATHFSGPVLEKLCKHFKVPLEQLLYIEPDPTETQQ